MFDQHADPVSRHSHSIEQTNPKPVSTTVKPKKKRDGSSLRKAPGAPKRFKSSYIMFFMAKQKEIKSELGEGASVSTPFCIIFMPIYISITVRKKHSMQRVPVLKQLVPRHTISVLSQYDMTGVD